MSIQFIEAPVTSSAIHDRWGVMPMEYREITDKKDRIVDFQDMMVDVAANRAATLEQEVAPLSLRVQHRNQRLSKIGNALSELSAYSARFDTSDTDPSKTLGPLTPTARSIITEIFAQEGITPGNNGRLANLVSTSSATIYKSIVDEASQKLKTESEKLNNDSQINMSRMQTLVETRDQSFNTATTMMNHISDSRGFTIKSIN